MGLKIAIKGKQGGHPEMVEYFRKQGVDTDLIGNIEDQHYFITDSGRLVSEFKPEGYDLYESVKDIVKRSNTYELWD